MKNTVAVIGTTFVDCKGFSDGKSGKYVAAGRNTGHVQFVHGGVGRNVAENLAGLGQNVIFVSTVDESALGKDVLERLAQHGTRLDFVAQEPEKGMGLWMVILDETGEQVGALSHMPELILLENLLDKRGAELMKQVSHIALEIDLTETIAQKVLDLAETYHKPVYALPGNLSVALARPDLLARLTGFICNQVEIGKLIQRNTETLTPHQLLDQMTIYSRQCQIPCFIVTMGEKGAIYYHAQTGEKGYVPAIPTQVEDVSGAGDAFFSGTLCGIMQGKSLKEAVQMGTQLASLTIQTRENCCQAIFAHQALNLEPKNNFCGEFK